jgi:hypothetical protein
MKISRQRKNTKKKNYGSSKIPKSLTSNPWWRLISKVNEKDGIKIYEIF